MKRLLFLLVLMSVGALLAIQAPAQTPKSRYGRSGKAQDATEVVYRQVPVAVRQTFHRQFPKVVSSVWTKEEGVYISTFYNGTGKVQAVFAPEGQWLRTRNKISTKELPWQVNDCLAANYKQWIPRTAYRLESNNSDPIYRVDLLNIHEKKTVFVTSDGVLTSLAAMAEASLAER